MSSKARNRNKPVPKSRQTKLDLVFQDPTVPMETIGTDASPKKGKKRFIPSEVDVADLEREAPRKKTKSKPNQSGNDDKANTDADHVADADVWPTNPDSASGRKKRKPTTSDADAG